MTITQKELGQDAHRELRQTNTERVSANTHRESYVKHTQRESRQTHTERVTSNTHRESYVENTQRELHLTHTLSYVETQRVRQTHTESTSRHREYVKTQRVRRDTESTSRNIELRQDT